MISVQTRRWYRRIAAVLMTCGLLIAASTTQAQNDKKKKKKNDAPAADTSGAIIPLSDEQQIDYMISETLGAWQIGDTERMHKNYLDDVSVVNGGWAPPIIGWGNYQMLFKQQRATMQQIRLDRSNTYIKVNGATAWACYQWDFSAVVNGTPAAARGQTTYVLVKKDNRWLIAHDHTSVVQSLQQQQPATNPPPAGAAPPTKPGS
jgi:ketosteroid isomerase-like protein